MRIHPAAVVLLIAACSPRDAHDVAAEKTDAPPAAVRTDSTATRRDTDPPDFGDPRAFVSLAPLRWADVETKVDGDRLARLRALGIQPLRTDSTGPREPVEAEAAGDHDLYGERASDFHFVDFSGDGVDDVVYDGLVFMQNDAGEVGSGEGTHFKLFQVMDGRTVEVMEHYGSIQRVWKGRPGEPISFRTVLYGCCGEVQWGIDYFRPAVRGDTVRFEPYHHVLGREEMRMPTRFLPASKRFTVNNDGYALRASPDIRDAAQGSDGFPAWEGHGNVVAEYGKGARGTAIAEETDSTGRVWWFVRMDGATPPTAAQVDAPYVGDRPVPADRVGWMSSRFVTVQP